MGFFITKFSLEDEMTDKLLNVHTFQFNEKSNGGEALILKTLIYSNGDPNGIYFIQELSLNSYFNNATFTLSSCSSLTPEVLRKLANELESATLQAKSNK